MRLSTSAMTKVVQYYEMSCKNLPYVKGGYYGPDGRRIIHSSEVFKLKVKHAKSCSTSQNIGGVFDNIHNSVLNHILQREETGKIIKKSSKI